jgi:hypothetical protein
MPENNIYYSVPPGRTYRLLFLVFLAFFAISPIADAYCDSLCSSLFVFNDLNDADDPDIINDLKLHDDCNSRPARKRASELHHDQTRTLPKDDPAGRVINIQRSANDLKSSQCCPPVSSDLSPPRI